MSIDIAELEREILGESPLEFQFWAQCKDEPSVPLPLWHEVLYGVETDFSWRYPVHLVVMIQGGVTDGSGKSRGAHLRKDGYQRDRDFANVAQTCGWVVYEFTKERLDDNSAIKLVKQFFEMKGRYPWDN